MSVRAAMVAPPESTTSSSVACSMNVRAHLDPAIDEGLARVATEPRVELGSSSFFPSTSRISLQPRLELAVVATEHEVEELVQGAGVLHACRPPAGHDEGEPVPALLVIGGLLGPFQAGEHVVSQAQRLIERLQPDGVLGQGLVAEGVVLAPGGQDEVAVWQVGAGGGVHALARDVDPLHAHLADVHVRRLAEDRAEGIGDVGGVQEGRGHRYSRGVNRW